MVVQHDSAQMFKPLKPLRMRADITGCCFIWANSFASSLPVFVMMLVGTPILPISWSSAAIYRSEPPAPEPELFPYKESEYRDISRMAGRKFFCLLEEIDDRFKAPGIEEEVASPENSAAE